MQEEVMKWKIINKHQTLHAESKDGIITKASPKLQVLIGRPIDDLAHWAEFYKSSIKVIK